MVVLEVLVSLELIMWKLRESDPGQEEAYIPAPHPLLPLAPPDLPSVQLPHYQGTTPLPI